MILRPVRPQSAWGPPSTKVPVGFTRTRTSDVSMPAGSSGLITCSMRSGLISVSASMPGWCWVEMSTVVSLFGVLPS